MMVHTPKLLALLKSLVLPRSIVPTGTVDQLHAPEVVWSYLPFEGAGVGSSGDDDAW